MKKYLYLLLLFLLVSCAGSVPDGHARVVRLFPREIAIQAPNGLFVSINSDRRLVADKRELKEASVFRVVNMNGDFWGLLGENGYYVAADRNKKNQLIARSDQVTWWEKFLEVKKDNGKIAIVASDAKYIALDSNQILTAMEGEYNNTCLFKLIDL